MALAQAASLSVAKGKGLKAVAEPRKLVGAKAKGFKAPKTGIRHE